MVIVARGRITHRIDSGANGLSFGVPIQEEEVHVRVRLPYSLWSHVAAAVEDGEFMEGIDVRRLREGVFDEADLRRRTDELAAFVAGARERYGLAAPVAVGSSDPD